MPFRILQEEKEELPEPSTKDWNTRTTINRLYEENNQKKDPAPKDSDLSEPPRELVEIDVIAEDLMAVNQTVVPIAPPSL